ncbi:MAG: indole-3-glycerol phosphate synthase TrpC [Magnetococcales bacterium]|nr:indole-3-glycerol phosphate synthase TrpC [Magnetococcales bacterium]
MPTPGNILDRIMETKREEVARGRSQTPEARLLATIRDLPATRGFADAIESRIKVGGLGVIAEIKRASPSKGVIREGVFDPAWIAERYQENGAACLSCLTDRDYFQGDDAYINQIRERVSLPVLRKDFLFDPYQVVEARAIGADAILLIMAVLSNDQAGELEEAARELHMDVLVEVHDEAELERAHDLKTPLLGINNRNLKTFETTLETTLNLAPRADGERRIISESGIRGPEDIKTLRENGIDAFLIGEAFMREEDPGEGLAKILA